jgi:hypothetical protein
MPGQYLASAQRPRSPLVRSRTQSVYSAARTNATNTRVLCSHSSLWFQSFSEVYGQVSERTQETLSKTTKPHEVSWQSGGVLVDTSSALLQRQVTDAPPPLTADSFHGNAGQPGAIPDDRLRSGYNLHVVAQHGQITLTRCRPTEWGFDPWGANVQLSRSHIVDPFSSNVFSNQMSQGAHLLWSSRLCPNLTSENLSAQGRSTRSRPGNRRERGEPWEGYPSVLLHRMLQRVFAAPGTEAAYSRQAREESQVSLLLHRMDPPGED